MHFFLQLVKKQVVLIGVDLGARLAVLEQLVLSFLLGTSLHFFDLSLLLSHHLLVERLEKALHLGVVDEEVLYRVEAALVDVCLVVAEVEQLLADQWVNYEVGRQHRLLLFILVASAFLLFLFGWLFDLFRRLSALRIKNVHEVLGWSLELFAFYIQVSCFGRRLGLLGEFFLQNELRCWFNLGFDLWIWFV